MWNVRLWFSHSKTKEEFSEAATRCHVRNAGQMKVLLLTRQLEEAERRAQRSDVASMVMRGMHILRRNLAETQTMIA
jgi:hypothetical protein